MTITKHRHLVMYHCFKAGIGLQGLFHDLSKYSPEEFIPGAKYYQGTRSPNEKERELFGYSRAWMHHQGRNKHHFEYWVDYNPGAGGVQAVPMPDRYIKEMFCDRVAACKIYRKKAYTCSSPLEYYEAKNSKDRMHPETRAKLLYLLKMLSERGEKETFHFLRTHKRLPTE